MVDTNVPVVANRQSPQASAACVHASIEMLERVRAGLTVIDHSRLILQEYRRNLHLSGQPGAGDAFFKWLWDRQDNSQHCQQVRITPREPDSEVDFAEFPDDPELAGFDPDDRKFVAVARASANRPEVLNAVDSDWWLFRLPLQRHGVRVRFLCPDQPFLRQQENGVTTKS